MPKGFELFVALPPQYWLTKEKTTAKQDTSTILIQSLTDNQSIKNSALSQVLLNNVNGLSGSILWGGINAMQLISCSALFNLVLPPNCNVVYQYLQNLTSFDIYNPVAELEIGGWTQTDPFNDNFANLGYGSLNFYDALGSIAIIILCILLL